MKKTALAYGIVFALLWGGAVVRAAAQPDAPPAFDRSANRISGHLPALDPFFEKLRALGEDTLSVVSVFHLGDSHVQAGFYPAAVRERFRRDFGNAGRGLIVPLKLARTNEPPDYLIVSDEEWTASRCIQREPARIPGIGGIALWTNAPRASFRITTPHEAFDRITVFHHDRAPLLEAPAESACEIGCPWEDTESVTTVRLRDSVRTILLAADSFPSEYSNPEFYAFSLENGRGGVLYHSAGINGNSYDSQLRADRMLRQTASLRPDLIVLSLGTNDSFGRNFDAAILYARIGRLVERLRAYHPQSTVLLTVPMECFTRVRYRGKTVRRPNPNSEKVRQQIIRAAEAYGLPYWDFYTVAGGKGARERWYGAGLSNADRIHLTREGYRLQGNLLYEALEEAYRTYCEKDK